ncbi:MAG TPA: primosomal protein N' [Candidatus Eisenbacteria bacterium]|nr:primosomal protein N' [Candidatus Eisenbacteria bacterium]
MSFAQVALALPLRQTFAYHVPDSLAAEVRPGVQVQVPFRGRARRGIVVSLTGENPRDHVLQVAAAFPPAMFDPHLLAFTRWIADYYLTPWGEVLSRALPGGGEGLAKSRARRAAVEDRVLAAPLPDRFTLTAEQRAATKAVEQAASSGGFAPLLLHGVTASGKTEVYLRGAAAARESGGQTLVLVPEVALSSQLVREFRRRFGTRVGVLHSYLSVAERRRNWELARRGALDVVVGARSAVFAPLPAPRLIVIDEEHEPAYKQGAPPRYHGRDAAVRRAQMLGIPVVLGSATPSLESLANASRGKYRLLSLKHRVDGRALPKVNVVDSRREDVASTMSAPLRHALAERLGRGEQAILFLNRRGHSHHTQCRACGFVPSCPHCDIALTLHLVPRSWRCHYCDHHEPARGECPSCGGKLLRFSGSGTQRAERELARAFPSARVLRLDTDVARDRERPEAILSAFARGEADVLVGTQMVAKGFDFPRVTLVGVLDADVALHLPDFRAAERTLQLVTQVAGRAGRGRDPGEVLVQTCSPEHPAIVAATTGDTERFVRGELSERREAGYPPFRRLATLLLDGPDESQVEDAAEACATALRPTADSRRVEVLGPSPHAFARLRGRHRWHVLLKGEGAAVRACAAAGLDWAETRARPGAVRVQVDVDPVEIL